MVGGKWPTVAGRILYNLSLACCDAISNNLILRPAMAQQPTPDRVLLQGSLAYAFLLCKTAFHLGSHRQETSLSVESFGRFSLLPIDLWPFGGGNT